MIIAAFFQSRNDRTGNEWIMMRQSLQNQNYSMLCEGFSETINLSPLASQKSSNHVKNQNRKSPSNRPAEGSEGRREFEFGE